MNVFDQRAIDHDNDRAGWYAGEEEPRREHHIFLVDRRLQGSGGLGEGTALQAHCRRATSGRCPVPCFNVVNGGRYEKLTQPFNEFILVPFGAGTVDEAVQIGVTVFQKLADVLEDHLDEYPQIASSYGYAAPSDDPEVILVAHATRHRNVRPWGEGRTSPWTALRARCTTSATGTYLLKGQDASLRRRTDRLRQGV